jgi:hypothetical protein
VSNRTKLKPTPPRERIIWDEKRRRWVFDPGFYLKRKSKNVSKNLIKGNKG